MLMLVDVERNAKTLALGTDACRPSVQRASAAHAVGAALFTAVAIGINFVGFDVGDVTPGEARILFAVEGVLGTTVPVLFARTLSAAVGVAIAWIISRSRSHGDDDRSSFARFALTATAFSIWPGNRAVVWPWVIVVAAAIAIRFGSRNLQMRSTFVRRFANVGLPLAIAVAGMIRIGLVYNYMENVQGVVIACGLFAWIGLNAERGDTWSWRWMSFLGTAVTLKFLAVAVLLPEWDRTHSTKPYANAIAARIPRDVKVLLDTDVGNLRYYLSRRRQPLSSNGDSAAADFVVARNANVPTYTSQFEQLGEFDLPNGASICLLGRLR